MLNDAAIEVDVEVEVDDDVEDADNVDIEEFEIENMVECLSVEIDVEAEIDDDVEDEDNVDIEEFDIEDAIELSADDTEDEDEFDDDELELNGGVECRADMLAEAVYDTRCGFVAIVGRPNVGKSTLLNVILGQKVSITSFKPQTTRHQILGIKTEQKKQTVYVDTPGIHHGAHKALNRQMNKVAHQAMLDVNAIIFVIEALKWTNEDDKVLKMVKEHSAPIMIAINKIDLVKEKAQLLAFMQEISEKLPQAEMVPFSAKRSQQIDVIESWVNQYIPMSPFYFPEDQLFNHTERFHLSEIIREKLMRQLSQELPYAIDVQIEALEHQDRIVHIHALIYAEREGQKPIIVGKKGQMLRDIGTKSREEMERFYGKKVCLKLWVKVKEGWSDNRHALQEMGYA